MPYTPNNPAICAGGQVRRITMLHMVELVERSAQLELREFIEPTRPGVKTSTEDVQRVVASMAAFISLIEHGTLECGLVEQNAPDLLKRFQVVRDSALSKVKSVRAVLVAALENAFGSARNETPDERLRRAIEIAKEEQPVSLGSFARYADENADEE